MSPTKPDMAIRFLGPFLPALAAGLLLAVACSSAEEQPLKRNDTQLDEPDDAEPESGGAAGAPAVAPPEAGSTLGGRPSKPPATGGAPTIEPEPEPEPGAAGSGGADPGPAEPTEAFLRGEELVEKNGCAVCHQADFGGFTVFPNISPDKLTGIGSWSDGQIADAIRNGVDVDGAQMCSTMQRFSFSEDEMTDVIEFLRGIPAVKRAITSQCPGHGG